MPVSRVRCEQDRPMVLPLTVAPVGVIIRNPRLPTATCWVMAPHPAHPTTSRSILPHPQNVYVGVDTNTVYYSNDGGVTFHPPSFRARTFEQGRQSLAVGPAVPPPNGPPLRSESSMRWSVRPMGWSIRRLVLFLRRGIALESRLCAWPDGAPVYRRQHDYRRDQSHQFLSVVLRPGVAGFPYRSGDGVFGGVGLYKSSGSFGHSWTFLAPAGGVHSDQHALFWDPANNQVLVANDGGLYMFDPAVANPPLFHSIRNQCQPNPGHRRASDRFEQADCRLPGQWYPTVQRLGRQLGCSRQRNR